MVERGRFTKYRGDLRTAISIYEEALKIIRFRLCNLALEAACLQFLGEAFAACSDYATADEYSRECLRICIVLGLEKSSHHMNAKSCLADIAVINSRWEDALNLYRDVLPMYQHLRLRDREANCLLNLGRVSFMLGFPASQYLDRSLVLWQNLEKPWGVATCRRAYGDIAMAEERFSDARKLYLESEGLFLSGGWKSDAAESCMKLGEIAWITNETDPGTALGRFWAALRLYRESQELLGQANCLRRIADVLVDQQMFEDAFALLQSAFSAFVRVGLEKEWTDVQSDMTLVCQRINRASSKRILQRSLEIRT